MSSRAFGPAPHRSTPAAQERRAAARASLRSRGRPRGSSGKALDSNTRQLFESRFRYDFSRVRVHSRQEEAESAVALGASAYTFGRDIVFAPGRYQPGTDAGRRLLAHELAHVIQQGAQTATSLPALEVSRADDTGERAAERAAEAVTHPGRSRSAAPGDGRADAVASLTRQGPAIQRAITPEDVSAEMAGRRFQLTKAFSANGVPLPAGTAVTVVTWFNLTETVVATAAGVPGAFDVPKRLLAPSRTAVPGMDPYSSGVAAQAATVETGEAELADWEAKKGQYKTPKAVETFEKERLRREDILAKRRKVLNRRLIQETMFNRFDKKIKEEVDAANAAHGLTGRDALDPNLVKSMFFQETQLGTAGTHLEVPPSHPTKTRFNLAQVIDSSGLALITLLEAEHPAVVTSFSLGGLRTDLAAAQRELVQLTGKTNRTAAENTRLAALQGLSRQNWEPFIWGYKAAGASTGFADAIASFFAPAAGGTPRNEDYDFWIHIAVFWLFKKHRSGMSWPDAIKAYNGSGTAAEHYRDAVVNRAAGAKQAGAGGGFVPSGI
ncbi:DUF4157 domain-containing protein [Streptomyces klenkii]|uniref:eCIS core domain-containing protein n=1 Tax=Streptomyces klenkii TaxID=1420899 RepID=UPI0036E160B4